MTPRLTLIAVFERAEDARAAREALAGSGLGAQTLEPEGEVSDFKSDGSIRDTVQDIGAGMASTTGEEGRNARCSTTNNGRWQRSSALLACVSGTDTVCCPWRLDANMPAEVEARLEALAKATGRTKTFYAREAILEHLDDLEDLYLAEQRLIDIRAGRSRTHTLEEVERDVGLAD